MTATAERNLKDRQKVRKSLHEIFEAHEELVEYCDWLHKLSSRLAFVIVTFNTYAFCSSSILILTSNFYGGIGFIFQSFVTLLTFCSMGALVRIQHERLLDAMWKFEWYKLPLADQKDWLNFMTKAQKPFQIETIFIGIIDLELFIKVSENICFWIKLIDCRFQQIMNAIYSYFMVMWNMITAYKFSLLKRLCNSEKRHA